jgi:hydroxymethylglutaryl-CoA lyase
MKIIECPRDAMQGLAAFIPTADKIDYINQLLKIGFDTIDFGSFVSPKAIPQLRDTAQVLEKLNWQESKSKLLAIVANTRGAQEASVYEAIAYLGFPLSISPTFQLRNTNKTISEALRTVEEIQTICLHTNKRLVVYISMGFGNPYGDAYDIDRVADFVHPLEALGVSIISLADTIGVARPENISLLVTSLSKQYPALELGVHLHSTADTAVEKIEAALNAGCIRLDGAIRGFGGCPMAHNDLVGNLATETILSCLSLNGVSPSFNEAEFIKALGMADKIFPK